MPYVESAQRPYLDEVVDSMKSHSVDATGDLNYILFAYCKRHMNSYQKMKSFMAELRECEAEIRRRLFIPYENKKLGENGDVR